MKVKNTDQIEPWMDQPQTLPLYLLNTESQKFNEKQTKIRRYASLELNNKSLITSPKK